MTLLAALALVAGVHPPTATDEKFGTAAEAHTLAVKAVAHVRSVGATKAHQDFTGEAPGFVEKSRRCVLLLSNDVRAESLYQRLSEATLGDSGMPWAWESYRPYDEAPAPSK